MNTGSIRLGDIVRLLPGRYLSREEYFAGGRYIVYGSNSIMGSHDRYLYEGPLIILSRIGSYCGAVMWSPQPAWVNNNASAIKVRSGADPHYIYYWLRTHDMSMHRRGSGQPFLSHESLLTAPIALPSLDEQRAIAEVLGALDDKIEANSRLALLCEDLAIAELQTTVGKAPVGAFAHVVRDHIGRSEFADREVDHYSLPAFDNGRLPERCLGGTLKSGKFRLADPTVLVSKLNPHIPRVWFAAPEAGVLSVASTEFVILAPNRGRSPEVLWAACAAPRFMLSLQKQVRGTTGSHQRVGPEDVLAALVPDLDQASAVVCDLVRHLVRAAVAARRESVHLAHLRDTLLAPLLSGELRVRDAEAVVGDAM